MIALNIWSLLTCASAFAWPFVPNPSCSPSPNPCVFVLKKKKKLVAHLEGTEGFQACDKFLTWEQDLSLRIHQEMLVGFSWAVPFLSKSGLLWMLETWVPSSSKVLGSLGLTAREESRLKAAAGHSVRSQDDDEKEFLCSLPAEFKLNQFYWSLNSSPAFKCCDLESNKFIFLYHTSIKS